MVTAVILPLISYAGTRLISYLNSKIKNEKAKDLLNWEAKLSVDKMCEDSWRWQKNNPDGYDN